MKAPTPSHETEGGRDGYSTLKAEMARRDRLARDRKRESKKAGLTARFLGARTNNCALHKYKTCRARKPRSDHRYADENVNSSNDIHLAYGLRAQPRPLL
jgi:hypothetical protein